MSGSVWYLSFSKKKIEFKKYPKKKKKKNNKLKKHMLLLFLFGFVALFTNFISAAPINDTFHLNIQTIYSNGSVQTGTFSFAFNITESSSSSCGAPMVYNHSTSLATDARGIVSIYLPQIGSGGGNLSSLSFDKQYYLCYYKDGSLINVSQLGRVPYAFRATQVNLSEITVNSNLTLGDFNVSASSGFFSFLGSLLNRITTLFTQNIQFNGTINGSGNLTTTGRIGIGTETPSEEVEVAGDILISGAYQGTGNEIIYAGSPLGQVKFFRPTLTNDIALYAGGSERIRINGSQGNVGINTTTPQNMLNVVGDGNITGVFYTGNASFNNGWTNGGISILGGELYAQKIYVYNITSLNVTQQNLSILTDLRAYGNAQIDKNLTVSGVALFVDNNTGNVGINTTTPKNKLNVVGDINATTTIYSFNKNLSIGYDLATNNTFAQLTTLNNGTYANNPNWDTAYTLTTNNTFAQLTGANFTGLLNTTNDVFSRSTLNLTIPYYLTTNNTFAQLTTLNNGTYITQPVLNNGTYVIASVLNNGSYLNYPWNSTNTSYARIDAANTFQGFNQTFDTNTLFIDSNNDRVGIGTTSPVNRLGLFGGGITIDSNGNANELLLVRNNTINNLTATFSIQTPGAAQQLRIDAINPNTGAGVPLVLQTSGGNVGIGTATPNYLLHISKAGTGGGLAIERTDASASLATMLNVGGQIVFDYNGSVGYAFKQSGTEQVRINSGLAIGSTYVATAPPAGGAIIEGNVGINTTTPGSVSDLTAAAGYGAVLDVKGPIRAQAGIISLETNNPTGDPTGLSALIYNKAGIGPTISGNTITFRTNNTGGTEERMRISNAGNVGIGTTGPSQSLDIRKAGTAGANTPLIYLGNSGSNDANTALSIDFGVSSTTQPGAQARIQAIRTGSPLGQSHALAFWTNPSGTLTEVVRIDPNGNVGIGTTSPGTKLHLYDSTATTDLPSLKIDSTYIAGDTTGLPMSSIYFANTGTNVNAIQSVERTINNYALDFQTYNGASLGTRMTILGGGNVGIGTTSPDKKLSIVKDSTYNTESTYGIGIKSSDIANYDTGLHFGVDSTNDIGFIQSMQGSDFTIRALSLNPNGGNVGIGTTSPGSLLELKSSAATLSINASSTGDADPTIIFQTDGGEKARVIYDESLAQLSLYVNSDHKLVVEDGGNVGIGTTGPGEKLQVAGAIKVTGIATTNLASSGAIDFNSGIMRLLSNGADVSTNGKFRLVSQRSDGTNAITVLDTDSTGQVAIGQYSDTNTAPTAPLHVVGGSAIPTSITAPVTQLRLGRSGTVGNKYPATADFMLGTYSATLNSQTRLDIALGNGASTIPDATVMTLLGSGNVGIGTTSPAAILDVYDSASASAADLFKVREWNGSVDLPHLIVKNGGNVGIGTTSPGAKLDVNGTSGTNNAIRVSNSGDLNRGGWIFADGAAGAGNLNISTTSSNYGIVFAIDGTEKARITPGGLVGIGTTSPGYKITIEESSTGKLNLIGLVNPNTATSGQSVGMTFRTRDVTQGRIRSERLANTITGNLIFEVLNASTLDVQPADSNFTKAIEIQKNPALTGTLNILLAPTEGNVGIGTTSPQDKLHVVMKSTTNGDGISIASVASSGAGSQPSVAYLNTTNSKRWSAGIDITGDYYQLVNATGISNFVVLQSGNVGIGTTTPTGGKLNVVGDINSTTTIYSMFNKNLTIPYDLTTNNTFAQLTTLNNGTYNAWAQLGNGTMITATTLNNGSYFSPFGVSIDSSEITDNTIAAIDIASNAINTTHIVDGTILNGDIANGQITALKLTSDLGLGWANLTTYPGGCATDQTPTTIGDTITCSSIAISDTQVTDAGKFLLATGDTATGNYTFDSPTFHIDSTNNRIGIGTTTPQNTLNVIGDINATTTIYSMFNKNLTISYDLSTNNTFAQLTTLNNGTYNAWAQLGNGTYASWNQLGNGTMRPTSNLTFLGGNVGIGTTTPTGGKLNIFGGNLNMSNNSIVDVWKVTINTGGGLDPPYRVGDKVYTTWAPFMVGQKEEVTGTVTLHSNYTIDFNNLEIGSDLWLFNQVTDFGKDWKNLQVVLTPGFDGRVWYTKDPIKKTLTIFGTQVGEVSYRLTGNSFAWGNKTNIASDLNISNWPDMANRVKIW